MLNPVTVVRRIVLYLAGIVPAAIDRGDYAVACGYQAADHFDYKYDLLHRVMDWMLGFGEGLFDALLSPARRTWRQMLRHKRLGHLTDAQLAHLLQTHWQVEDDLRHAANSVKDQELHAASIAAIDRAFAVNKKGMHLVLEEMDARYTRSQSAAPAGVEEPAWRPDYDAGGQR